MHNVGRGVDNGARAAMQVEAREHATPANDTAPLPRARLVLHRGGAALDATGPWARFARLYAHGVALADNPATQGRAVACLDRVTREVPWHVDTWLALGYVHARRGDHPAAEQAYSAAVALDETAHAAHYGLGWSLAQQGRWGDALAHLATAQRLDPTALDVYPWLVRACERCDMATTADTVREIHRVMAGRVATG